MCYWIKIAFQFGWIGRFTVLGKICRRYVLPYTHFGSVLQTQITRVEYSKGSTTTAWFYNICTDHDKGLQAMKRHTLLTSLVYFVCCTLKENNLENSRRTMIVGFLKVNGCPNLNSSLGIQASLILNPVVEGRKVLKSHRIKINTANYVPS